MKSIRPTTDSQRAIILAIKHDIAIYAIHTNLDRVIDGVNKALADRLNLTNRSILQEASNLLKLVTYVPLKDLDIVRNALFSVGAGSIGEYDNASYVGSGLEVFKEAHLQSKYRKRQVSLPKLRKRMPTRSLVAQHFFIPSKPLHYENHPYEEVAYDIVSA